MNKRIIISEEEKKQIRTLHETQKKEVNYFQILESKVNRLIVEQGFTGQGKLPELKAGEKRGEGGQIISSKIEEIPPLNIEIDATFPANKYEPYNPRPEDLKKLNQLVTWLNNRQLINQNVQIKVNSGSSKTGNYENNKKLAIKRGETGINFIKEFLKDKISEQIYNNIVFPEPTDELANQGPEPGEATQAEYREYQKFKIIATATGTIKTQTAREVNMELYKPQDAPFSGGFTFEIGDGAKSLAKKLGIVDQSVIDTLYNNWPQSSLRPRDRAVQGANGVTYLEKVKDSNYVIIPSFEVGWVTFCINGFETYTSGKYLCSSSNPGYRQVYGYNGTYPGNRWLAYPSIDDKVQPETSAFFNNNPLFKNDMDKLCFISEGYKAKYHTNFFKAVEGSPYCQSKYSSWPDYKYKLTKKEVPGPESPWYKTLLNTIWYKDAKTNGGLWTAPSGGEKTTG